MKWRTFSEFEGFVQNCIQIPPYTFKREEPSFFLSCWPLHQLQPSPTKTMRQQAWISEDWCSPPAHNSSFQLVDTSLSQGSWPPVSCLVNSDLLQLNTEATSINITGSTSSQFLIPACQHFIVTRIMAPVVVWERKKESKKGSGGTIDGSGNSSSPKEKGTSMTIDDYRPRRGWLTKLVSPYLPHITLPNAGHMNSNGDQHTSSCPTKVDPHVPPTIRHLWRSWADFVMMVVVYLIN